MCKISKFFTFKDSISSFLRTGIVYKFQCGGCNAAYYGKTKRYFYDNSAIRNIFHSGNTCLILNIFNFETTLMENVLINKEQVIFALGTF